MSESARSILRAYRRLQLPTPFVTTHDWSSGKRYFLTVGFGERFARAARRLGEQARASGWFDEVWCIDTESALFNIEHFLAHTATFRQRFQKGFGLWYWKPYLVWRALSAIEPGARLFYVDAGCEVSIFGEERFKALDAHACAHGSVFFTLPFSDRNWTKPSLLRYLGIDQSLAAKPQVQATWFGLANVPATRELISRWWDECSRDDYWALQEDSENDSRSGLVEHRHDQSVLSCLIKTAAPTIRTLPWEDFYAPWLYHRNSFVLLEPVHALRNDSHRSLLESMVKASTLAACKCGLEDRRARPAVIAAHLYHMLRDEAASVMRLIRRLCGA